MPWNGALADHRDAEGDQRLMGPWQLRSTSREGCQADLKNFICNASLQCLPGPSRKPANHGLIDIAMQGKHTSTQARFKDRRLQVEEAQGPEEAKMHGWSGQTQGWVASKQSRGRYRARREEAGIHRAREEYRG